MITLKQEKFVEELIKGKSQREAYKAAYNTLRMKDETIDSKASILFKKKEIRARYDELLAECIKDDVDEAESIRKEIIEQEKAILRANIGDLFEVRPGEDGKSLISVPKNDLSSFDMRAVKAYSYDRKGRLIVELYDKQPAIKALIELYKIATQEEKDDIEIILKAEEEGFDA